MPPGAHTLHHGRLSLKPCVQVFRYNLNLQFSFTAEELEAVLAESPGNEGLLADLHMVRPAGLRGRGLAGRPARRAFLRA